MIIPAQCLLFTALLFQAVSFEVASIKPSAAESSGSSSSVDKGLLRMQNVTLKRCMMKAYGIPDEARILGGPKWTGESRYDILAKPDHPVGGDEFNLMFQALLADRFQLAIHHEMRPLQGYALTVAKSGIKAKPAAPDTPANALETMIGGPGRTDATATSMVHLAMKLAGILGVPVVDATELPGNFDFSLRWTPDDMKATAADSAPEVSQGPSLFTALQEQTGLKLEARKIPTDMLVIDHAELPSGN